MTEALAARRAALSLIGRVLGEGRVLDEAAAGLDALAPPERARALRLAAECFRRIEPADRALAPLLRRAPPVEVRNLLRLAVTELSLRPGDAHGIVHSAVSIARAGGRMRHQAGLVNAVLRKLAGAGDPLAGLPAQRMPRWLRQPLVHH
ncbi:MAG: transcription antitermination factor NusB, partial [Gemmobacter sp.]